MAADGYTIEPLALHHDRGGFRCGVAALDNYLHRQARQDSDRNLASVFVLTPDSRTIAGFYTLSASSILAVELPIDLQKRLPRFPLPVTLLGRMAVAVGLQGKGLGDVLLSRSLERAWITSKQHVASWAVIVDAKQGARAFYLKHGFIPLPSQAERLFIPMATIEKMVVKTK